MDHSAEEIFRLLSIRKKEELDSSEIEVKVIKMIPDMTPTEINLFMKNFYNSDFTSGFSDEVKLALQVTIKEDAQDMDQEEVVQVTAGVHASQMADKELSQYLDSLVEKQSKELNLESILYLLNLKLKQPDLSLLSKQFIDNTLKPQILRVLSLKDFDSTQYGVLVFLLTVMGERDPKLWSHIIE